mmetsp:Transcript_69732/g.220778  ORF Transcript_69732/g.220778 Transcript_69732/m.220778 type:complete len:87 (+) Transcript_69732:11-271(+)
MGKEPRASWEEQRRRRAESVGLVDTLGVRLHGLKKQLEDERAARRAAERRLHTPSSAPPPPPPSAYYGPSPGWSHPSGMARAERGM